MDTISHLLADQANLDDISQSDIAAIAQQVEATALAHENASANDLAEKLRQIVVCLLRSALPEVREAIRGVANAAVGPMQAFTLGQLNFAQAITAQIIDRRANKTFFEALHDMRFEKYVSALSQCDLTGLQLADKVGERAETVSRKLKELRELGITDFRREGTSSINFLTPSARAEVHDSYVAKESEEISSPDIGALCEDIPPHLRGLMSFSSTNQAVIKPRVQ